MDLDVVWNLPTAYRDPRIASQLSADAQVYFRCLHCGDESRIDVLFVTEIPFDAIKCPGCHRANMGLVRHLEERNYHCQDCSGSFLVSTARYLTDRCQDCGSNRLTILASSVDPPYPPRFHELLLPKDSDWGISAQEDSTYIVRSTQNQNLAPDFPLYLLINILFAERLRLTGGYKDPNEISNLLNLEGNLYRDYFRRTGETWAGVRAIPIFERCVREESDPVNRALMEHNVSMAIYSLLSQNDERLVEIACGRKDIRRSGIEAAQRALAMFESDAPVTYLTQESIRAQRSRIHHLLGDLLNVGNATEAERREAIRHFDDALSLNALDRRLTAAIMVSRATTVCRLENPGSKLTAQAIHDFEFAISQQEVGRAWSDKIDAFLNLSILYQNRNNFAKATQYSEQAVAIALHEINMNVDEQILKQKASKYSPVFEQLVTLYAIGRLTEKALSVSEASRARTIRIHTMSSKEKASYEGTAAMKAIRATYERLVGGGGAALEVPALRIEAVLPQIERLRDYVQGKDTALVSLHINRGLITALILGRKKLFSNGVETRRWEVDPSVAKSITCFADLDPSPFREERIRLLCDLCRQSLLDPLRTYFTEHGIRRVGMVVPSLIGQLPFEGCERPHADGSDKAKDIDFFYLPSLRVGSDLVGSVRGAPTGKLLIVGYADDDLPSTVHETEIIKGMFKDRATVLNTQGMSKLVVFEELQKPYDYIHFTCHGSFDSNVPLDSALHLLQNPQNDSQRITARELLAIKLPTGPVVTMSACSTALVGRDSSNGYAGLTGSLLRGGARCVIGSRWPVYDDSASTFMISLYTKLVSSQGLPFDCFSATQSDRTILKDLEDWAAFAYVGLP